MTQRSASRTLVICVGNGLVADDAVGCQIHEKLQAEQLPEQTRLELLGVGGLSLLELLDGEEQLIVVDAVQFGSDAGQVHVLDWDDLPQNKNVPVSLHGIGIHEAITMGRLLYPEQMPQKVTLIGIEGVCFDQFAVGLTPAVANAVDKAVAKVRELI